MMIIFFYFASFFLFLWKIHEIVDKSVSTYIYYLFL